MTATVSIPSWRGSKVELCDNLIFRRRLRNEDENRKFHHAHICGESNAVKRFEV